MYLKMGNLTVAELAERGATMMLPYPEWLAANGVEPRPACDRWNQGEDGNDE